MQLILRKPNPNFDGISAGSIIFSNAAFYISDTRFNAAELFHLIFPGFQKRINSLINFKLFQYNLFEKKVQELNFVMPEVPMNGYHKFKIFQTQTLIRKINPKTPTYDYNDSLLPNQAFFSADT